VIIRRKIVPVAVSLLAVMVTVAACGGSSGKTSSSSGSSSSSGAANTSDATQGVSKTSVDYGIIYDQTGSTATTQIPWGDGIQAYFSKVNAAGGVNGRKINPVNCDEQYMVAPAMACLNNLIKSTPVVGLAGLNNSSFQVAGLPVVQAAKIPVIGTQSTGQAIVSPDPGYVWATACSFANQADVAVAYAAKKLGKTSFTAVGLGGNVASATAYLGSIKARVQKAGANYLSTVQYTYGAPNMDQEALQISQLKPDVIFLHGGTSQAVTAFKSLEKYGITNTLIIGIGATETDATALASPKVGANFYSVNCSSNGKQTDVPGVAAMVAAGKAGGFSATIYNDSNFTAGYIAGIAIVEALKKAGANLTRQSLNDAVSTINNLDTGGLSPNISFSKTNSVGVSSVRPYKYNYSTGVWEGQGTYADYAKCNSNEYVAGNINAWSPGCITS
jgi:branched-chain amino acid transport system substrate-binding protein